MPCLRVREVTRAVVNIETLGHHVEYESLSTVTRGLIESLGLEPCGCEQESVGFWLCRYHRGFEDGLRAAEAIAKEDANERRQVDDEPLDTGGPS